MPSRVGTRTPPSEVGEGRATFLQGAFLVEILCIQTVNTVCPATGAMKPVPTGTRVGSIVHIAGHRCLCFLSRRGLSRETCFLKSPVPPPHVSANQPGLESLRFTPTALINLPLN